MSMFWILEFTIVIDYHKAVLEKPRVRAWEIVVASENLKEWWSMTLLKDERMSEWILKSWVSA